MDRREFLTVAGTGLLATGPRAARAYPPAIHTRPAPDVLVVGAGAFGIWTALNLRRLGATVTVVDQHGPGNSRATSGGETRGVRSSYGERTTWVRWVNEAIHRWLAWDEEWRARLNLRVFFQTSDLILREDWDPWLTETRKNWDALGVPYEVLEIDEARYRFPQVDMDGFGVAVVERNAGVVRARRTCEAVSEVFRGEGGEVVIARAALGARSGGRMLNVSLDGASPLAAGQFVFACGPWLPKVMPEVMGNRLRIPMGHVYYYGPPPGDARFTFPNMPSYNVPGVTGWPALPPDFRGFRVRTGGRAPQDPDLSVRYIEPQFLERPRNFLAERFPALRDAPLLETRACHYESSVDRNFIVDRYPGLDNVWIAGGGSAEGFKFGPVVGEYIAKRVLGLETDPALAQEFRLKEEEFEPRVAEDDDEIGTPKAKAAVQKGG